MPSRKSQEMLRERLQAERTDLIRRKEALENQIVGVERAMALLGCPQNSCDDMMEKSVATISGSKRGATKQVVLDLLKDVGTTGLNAASAVEAAIRRGYQLDRATVSSLLSRLKKDRVVTYDGEKYRLQEFANRAKIVPLSGLRM